MATVTVHRVIDGDTFTYLGESGEEVSVRILGINAPEIDKGEYLSTAAKEYLYDKIYGNEVEILQDSTTTDQDIFGRLLRLVYYDGDDVAVEMVKYGLGTVTWPPYDSANRLAAMIAEDSIIRKVAAGTYTADTIWSSESPGGIAAADRIARENEGFATRILTLQEDIDASPNPHFPDYAELITPEDGATSVNIDSLIFIDLDFSLYSSTYNLLATESPFAVYKDYGEFSKGSKKIAGTWYQDENNRVTIDIDDSNLEYETWYTIYLRGGNATFLLSTESVSTVGDGPTIYYPSMSDAAGAIPYSMSWHFRTKTTPASTSTGYPYGWTEADISSSTPSSGEIDVVAQNVTIYFDHAISGVASIDWSSYVTLKSKSILGDRYTTATFDGNSFVLDDWSGSISGTTTGTTSTVTLTSGNWEYNTEYYVTIASGLPIISGWYNGGTFNWTSYYYPYYATPTTVKMDGGGLLESIPNSTINRYIVQESMEANYRTFPASANHWVPPYISASVASRLLSVLRTSSTLPTGDSAGGLLRSIGSISFHYGSTANASFEKEVGELTNRRDILRERIWPRLPIIFSTKSTDNRRPVNRTTWMRWPAPERYENYWTSSSEIL